MPGWHGVNQATPIAVVAKKETITRNNLTSEQDKEAYNRLRRVVAVSVIFLLNNALHVLCAHDCKNAGLEVALRLCVIRRLPLRLLFNSINLI